ncbi:MAG: RsmB/NOP family class I SAM-dependent RNA methyltransferase [Rhodobacteraceae bacterium]|nr:RsmB/NOP family class I SAM-dependent RNA methyltransferase [Paracoccaceae bacterium]
MTPAARCGAAIVILDAIIAGAAAEKALTNWARSSRFAGSGDRAAIRDIVYDGLRRMRSAGAAGGGADGRAIVLGLLRLAGEDPDQVFTGLGYAPPPLSEAERQTPLSPGDWPEAVRLDIPDWLEAPLKASLGADIGPVLERMQTRAPVFLRVNPRKATGDQAIKALAADGITAQPCNLAPFALEVTANPRRIANASAYRDGMVELQDAASQAVIAALDLPGTGRILDYCAGGGGKALAMAACSDAKITAHDANPARMRDIAPRAARAGASIRMAETRDLAAMPPFDLVLCDVPCSGSGAWRRDPGAKWRLSEADLHGLLRIQANILDRAADLVAIGGSLGYITCSLLDAENTAQITAFAARDKRFHLILQHRFLPLDGGDGLFVAQLGRVD